MSQIPMKYLLLILVLFLIRVDSLTRIELFKIHKPVPIFRTGRIPQSQNDNKAYMVYLRPTPLRKNVTASSTEWICAGVIIHKQYILTSAACIENVPHFLVISGTYRWISPEVLDDKCIKNGAKKAVWKGTPKSNFYDGGRTDNIRWIVGDIAVVKVEDEFDFDRKIRGCDFIPKKIPINKISLDLENIGTAASLVGWGSTERYTNIDIDSLQNTETAIYLMEADMVVITKAACKEYWNERYSNDIINDEMICTKDNENIEDDCTKTDERCKISAESEQENFGNNPNQTKRRTPEKIDADDLTVRTADHNDVVKGVVNGGFCENDHGGPLIIGEGNNAIVIGIMSACLTKNTTNKCSGPFLFTSVYKHKNLITACVASVYGPDCRKLMRSRKYVETFFDWAAHPQGPAISETSDKSQDIHPRYYAQTPREPRWPQSTTTDTFESPTSTIKYTSSEDVTHQPPLQRHFSIVGSPTFSKSSYLQQKRIDTFFPESRIQKTSQSTKKPSKINLAERHLLSRYIKNAPKFDKYTTKSDLYTSKSSKCTLTFVNNLPSDLYRPKHLTSAPVTNDDISTLKSQVYTSKSQVYVSDSDMNPLKEEMSTPEIQIYTTEDEMPASKSYMNALETQTSTPQYDTSDDKPLSDILLKETPLNETELDAENKLYDLLTIQLWNVHNFRSKPKVKSRDNRRRYQNNNIFVNKSYYLKKMRNDTV